MLYRFLLLFTVIMWGWTFVATKICLDYMSPVELLGLRLGMALPILLTIVRVKRRRFDLTPRLARQLGIAAFVITLHFLIQITGLKYTSATNTGWIISVTPLVTALLAFIFLKEKIGLRQIAGIVLATFGILLLISHGRLTSLDWLDSVGDWLVLASAHTWAIYTVVTRNLSRTRAPLAVTVGVLLPGTVLLLIYMAFTSDWSKFLHLPLRAVVALLFLGIVGMALAQWFWQEGVAAIGAAKAGIFLYLEPVATTALAVPLLNEHFGVFTAIGGTLVLLGVFVAEKRRRHKNGIQNSATSG
jgi:drug/metabolite transporter (DMT)-like permease